MKALLEQLATQQAIESLAWALIHFLWQGLAIAAIIELILLLCRSARPTKRYAICLVGLIAMAACPIVTLTCFAPAHADVQIAEEILGTPVLEDAPERSPVPNGTHTLPYTEDSIELPLEAAIWPAVETELTSHDRVPDEFALTAPEKPNVIEKSNSGSSRFSRSGFLSNRSLFWIVCLWLVGVALCSVRLLMSWIGVWRLRSHTEPVSDQLVTRTKQLAELIRVAQPLIRSSQRVTEAIAVGFLKPMILLPASWLAELSPDMLETIIVHELAHIRRGDLWVNLLQRVVEALLFYHPAVWWLSQRIRVERELCCDAVVVEATQNRLLYAETLEHVGRLSLCPVAKQSAESTLAVQSVGSQKVLLARIRSVLQVHDRQRVSPSWPAVVAILVVGCLLAITVLEPVSRTSLLADRNHESEVMTMPDKEAELNDDVLAELDAIAKDVGKHKPAEAQLSRISELLDQVMKFESPDKMRVLRTLKRLSKAVRGKELREQLHRCVTFYQRMPGGNIRRFETPVGEVMVSIRLEKPTIMLGEPTSLVFQIHNLSENDLFTINQHSRNQYGRPERFHIVATGSDGQQVELLEVTWNFGGITAWDQMPAGARWKRKLFLPNWFLLNTPGEYTIHCRTKSVIGRSSEATLEAFNSFQPGRKQRDPATIKDASVIEVDLATTLTVEPVDETKMGQLVDSLGEAALAGREKGEAAMKQLLAIDDPRTVPHFVKAVSMPDYSLRFQALRGLAKFDSDEALAGIEIGLATTDEDIGSASSSNIRHAAAGALSRSPHPKAEARLLSLLDDPNYAIRITAVHRLGKLKTAESLRLLKLKTMDLNSSVRGEAIRYSRERLANIDGDETPNAEEINFLRDLVRDYQAAYDQSKKARNYSADGKSFAYHWLQTTQGRLAVAENRLADAVKHFQNAVDEADKNHQQKKEFYERHHAPSGSSEHTAPVSYAHSRLIFAQGELTVTKRKLETREIIDEFAKTLQPQLPEGWSTEVIQNFLVIQRDQKTITVPKIGRRAKSANETEAEYNKDMGHRQTLDVKLRFAPRLSDEDWMELSGNYADLREVGKNGFKDKTAMSEHARLVDKYQLPSYETADHSIFVMPGVHQGYVEIIDNQAKQELDNVLALIKETLPANRVYKRRCR